MFKNLLFSASLLLFAQGQAQAAPVAFLCHGSLNSTAFDHEVPSYFSNILLKASTPADGENLQVSVAIGNDEQRFTQNFEARDHNGTLYSHGALAQRSDGGFFYVTYDLPNELNGEIVFKGQFVYAKRSLEESHYVRARFNLLCSIL